jgi:hypothetical protein
MTWQYLKEKFGVNGPDDGNETNESVAFNARKGQNKFKGNCYTCGKQGHKSQECYQNKQRYGGERHEQKKKALKANRERTKILFNENRNQFKSEVLLDSGATDHMFRQKEYFSKIIETNGDYIYTANNMKVEIRGVGEVDLRNGTSELKLKNVLYVPALESNLVSLGKLMENGKYSLNFNGDKVNLSKGNQTTVIGEKNLATRLFKLSENWKINSQIRTYNLKNRSKDDEEKAKNELELWHKRLGHANYRKINTMANLGLIETRYVKPNDHTLMKKCEICLKSKMKKLKWNKSKTSTATRIGQKVCTDLTGPVEIIGSQGERYIQVILDEYSNCLVLNCLKTKSQAVDTLINYNEMLKTKFGRGMDQLYADNGEIKSNRFIAYSRANGITNKWTNPGESNQNAKAERVIQTVVGVGRSLLSESKVKLKLWPYAMYMACLY